MSVVAPPRPANKPPQQPKSMSQAQTTKRGKGKSKRRMTVGTLILNIILLIGAMAGLGLLLYPDAADWFASRAHNAEISGYIDRVEQTPSEERERILAAAYAYNDALEIGPLMDPYIEQNPDEFYRDEVYQRYLELLRISGTDAIGTITYPRLAIGLPIYHGTTDETISKGVGHLYGTSLPVGGPGTRSVLTSHSGLPHAKLFSPLHDAKVGDQFWISVLGEDHYYEVREIETVLPGETESLQIIGEEDWVTLFTCTPIGVNSHRLMVHAQRIDGPGDDTGRTAIPGDGLTAGFPWWAVWFTLGTAAIAWLLFAPRRKKKKPQWVRVAGEGKAPRY